MQYLSRNPRLRALLSIIVMAATAAAFIYYFSTHPEAIDQIRGLDAGLVALLLVLYGCTTLSLVFILAASLRLIGKRMPLHENFLLTSYSSIVNFFGPLQSGPGVRLLYLKQRYNVSVKEFAFSTFLYYGFFALFSGLFLTINALAWWQSTLTVLFIAAASVYVIRRKGRGTKHGIPTTPLVLLALATLAQVLLVAVLYFVELRSVDPTVTFGQAVTYTGAANFALFVSLTPGAIGFRETFLLFSQDLHGISSSTVLAASLIDRTVNVAFLGLLFLITLALHARQRFTVRPRSSE